MSGNSAGQKRRKCPGCNLIESPEVRWQTDRCTQCEARRAAQPEPPSRKPRRSWPEAARLAKTAQAKANYVPYVCRVCQQTKQPIDFSPRTKREPAFYLHHSRCKACVCEQVKASIRDKQHRQYTENLEARTVRSLASELDKLKRRIAVVKQELERRDRLLKRTS
jgi:hypothetical protein